MKAIGFILCLFAAFFIALMAADFSVDDIFTMVDGAVIIYFILVILGTTFSSFGFKTLVGGINGALSKKYMMSPAQQKDAVALFLLLRTTMIYAAVIGVCAGLAMTLLKLSEPAELGPRLAICLQAALFGPLVNMVLINPVLQILIHKNVAETAAETPAVTERIKDKEAMDKLLQLCFEKGLTREDIMNADEIDLRRYQ